MTEQLIDIRQWWKEHPDLQSRDWLLIGKGPSFDQCQSADFSTLVTVGLNHVARETLPGKLDFLHLFDIDVIDSYDDSLPDRVRYLLMPDVPNEEHQLPLVNGTFHRSSGKPCSDWLLEKPLLQRFAREGRLLTYPRGSKGNATSSFPVTVGSFSAATVTDLLAKLGVRKLLLAGIDGGTSYSSNFTDLASSTLLSAGQTNFDLQFQEMADIKNQSEIEIEQLDTQGRPVVYVGMQPAQDLAYKVLAWSIRRHSSRSVDVLPLQAEIDRKIADYDAITGDIKQGTPFSLQRYAIPRLNDFKGRAIYVDSDMLVFTDIWDLWTRPTAPNGWAAARVKPDWGRAEQLSVLVIDCEARQWDLEDIAENIRSGDGYDHFKLVGPGPMEALRSLPPEWNSLEHYREGETRLVHFTNMNTQPWLSTENPLTRLWCEALLATMEAGEIDLEDIRRDVESGWVRPSLLWQAENDEPDPHLIPSPELHRDQGFLPPHILFSSPLLSKIDAAGQRMPSRHQLALRRSLARVRRVYETSGAKTIYRQGRSYTRKAGNLVSRGLRSRKPTP